MRVPLAEVLRVPGTDVVAADGVDESAELLQRRQNNYLGLVSYPTILAMIFLGEGGNANISNAINAFREGRS